MIFTVPPLYVRLRQQRQSLAQRVRDLTADNQRPCVEYLYAKLKEEHPDATDSVIFEVIKDWT